MKKIFFALIALCLLLSVSFAAFPTYTDLYVNDFANVLSADQTSQLRNYLSQLRTQTTAEVVVVTVNSLEGYAPIDYATNLGQTWGVGKKATDNGLVILYAKQENKIAVATGYGLEGILPDSKVGRILDEYYVPNRDAGNISQGIVDATLVYVNEINKNKMEVGATNNSFPVMGNPDYEGIIMVIAIALIILAIIIGTVLHANKTGFLGGIVSTIILFILGVIFFIAGAIFPQPYGFYLTFAAIIIMLLLASKHGLLGGSSYGGGYSGGFSGGGYSGGGSFGGGSFGGGGASR